MIYLSGASNERVRDVAATHPVGLLVQPGNSLHLQVASFRWWAADNGCFAQGSAFDAEAWLRWLYALPRPGCLFAVAPDVYGDAARTVERAGVWLRTIRAFGFPAALVAQDGAEELELPWPDFDVLFIGGTDDWKLTARSAAVAHAAHLAGKHVHMGRVNSFRRLRAAELMHCSSVDGTYVAFRARRELGLGEREIAGWLQRSEAEPFLPLFEEAE